eukprot:10435652-Karenia_brevis.AAC.1
MGRWIRAIQFRRECSMRFSNTWSEMARWKGMRPIPNRVRDELMCALMLIPLMRCDARVPVSGLVTCSDASLSGGA